MATLTKPIILDETGKDILQELKELNALAVGVKGDKGEKGDAFKYEDFTPELLESLRGPKGSEVTVSEEGTSTEEIKYITIDGIEKKISNDVNEEKLINKGFAKSVNGISSINGNIQLDFSDGLITIEKKKAELSYYKYLENQTSTKTYGKELRNATLNMEEFKKLGSGLFIHWGVYSVPAGTYTGEKVSTSSVTATKLTRNCEWALRDLGIPLDVYKNFQSQFTGENFNVETIVQMAKDCGMKYIIITAKHHEGFSLYPTNFGQWDIRTSACRNNVLYELKQACENNGLKFGLYYSQYWDWEAIGGYGLNHGGKWITEDPYSSEQHSSFITQVANQLQEIVERFEPYILWYDPGTNYTDGCKDVLLANETNYPHIITNDRISYGREYGDYGTGERTIYLKNSLKYGESCFTLNNTWGYSENNEKESDYYSIEKIFKEFWLYTISYGQNCLMNISPKADGSLSNLTITRWNQMKNFIQTYCGGDFYNYTRMSFNSRPNWGYLIGKPNNKVLCFITTYSNLNYSNIIIDGIDTTDIKENGIKVLTSQSATSEILDDYRIQINGLELDETSKIGVVEIEYNTKPLVLDCNYIKENTILTSGVFPVSNGAHPEKFNIINRVYKISPSLNTTLASTTIMWNETSKKCSLRLNLDYSNQMSGTAITKLTIEDINNSSNVGVLIVSANSENKNKESFENFYFEHGHKYILTYNLSGTDTNEYEQKGFSFFENNDVHVSSVELNKDLLELQECQITTIKATIYPTNATIQDVVWSTNNDNVMVIPDDEDSTLAAIIVKEGFEGTAIIKAESLDKFKVSASATVTSVLEDSIYNFEVESLSGNNDEILQDTNIYLFNDDLPNFTLFGWAYGSVNPASVSNATLFQCVVNASPWSGIRIDADNTVNLITDSNPSPVRPRFLCGSDTYFSMRQKEISISSNHDSSPNTEGLIIHPFYFSRVTQEDDSSSTYWWSFDGENWTQFSTNSTQLSRLATCPLTVGYDYKRNSGSLTTERYRFLKTEGLADSRACVKLINQPKYKFAKSLKNYDLSVKTLYEELINTPSE